MSPRKPRPLDALADDEKKLIQRAAMAVWEEVAYDCLQATAEEKGKSINSITMRRSTIVEIVLDASRLEERLKRLVAKGEFSQKSYDIFFNNLDYKHRQEVVKGAFAFTHYGM